MYFAGYRGKETIVEREDRVQPLVNDFHNGYLTRRGFLAKAAAFGLTAAAAVALLGAPRTQKTAGGDAGEVGAG
jgi:hypothetical protein